MVFAGAAPHVHAPETVVPAVSFDQEGVSCGEQALFQVFILVDILPRLKPWDSNSRKKHCLFLRRASPSVASGLQHMPQPWPLGYSASFVHGHRLRRILRVYRRAPSPFRRTDVCVRWLNVLVICFKIQSRRDILSRMLLYRSYTVPAPAGTLQSL